ncbi:DUF4407 domain-containing protein [Kineococcus sp. SYSU DK001]|uniref:DUF4407 domain-containing protein n=1 Tax=Kineococcus sp. SYSU DK001 TaxID=3383122 RepID=UPI003D7D2532
MRRLRSFLITVSGADRRILAQAPSEEVKQASLGGAILMTAGLGALSAAVAIHMAFDAPWWLALPMGAVWGLAILNLDRWLVVSTPRMSNWFKTVLMALPRIGLAIVVGAVISMPLTLQIFHDEIDEHLAVQHRADRAAFEVDLQTDPRYAKLDEKRQQIKDLQKTINTRGTDSLVFNDPTVTELRDQLATVTDDFQQAEKDVACEKEGTCGSGKAGVGPAAADKEARRDRLAVERAELQRQLDAQTVAVQSTAQEELTAQQGDASEELGKLQAEVMDLEQERADQIAAHDAAVAADDGLLARFGALRDMQQENSNIELMHGGLFLFLTVIECVPIIFKTMLSMAKPGLYEWVGDKDAEHVKDRLFLRHETEYAEAQLLADSRLDAARARAATELDAEIRAANVVLDAQVGLAEAAVQRWREEQTEKLADEVSQWLRTTNGNYDAAFGSGEPLPEDGRG